MGALDDNLANGGVDVNRKYAPSDLKPVDVVQYNHLIGTLDALFRNEDNIASVKQIVNDDLAPMYVDILQHHARKQHVSIAFAADLHCVLTALLQFQQQNANTSKLFFWKPWTQHKQAKEFTHHFDRLSIAITFHTTD
ncbi:hypothetical protein Gpo141_00010842 [Globisporangium polare]